MSKTAFQLGKFAGIPLKLHWTFGFTFLLVLGIGFFKKSDATEIAVVFLLLIVMFFCVVLHEYGHALMAKKFKVKTIDIILSPIGGLARLEKLPKKPIQEFYIAIAGPLVNAVISAILAGILYLASKPIIPNMRMDIEDVNNWEGYMSLILLMNIILFLFNLIPAFPMDGGRILRALLSIRLGKTKSTVIASYIGYTLAIIFIIYSLYQSYYMLSVIGIFVIIMARGELVSARQEEFLSKTNTDHDALAYKRSFSMDTKMQEIISHYYDQKASNFIILDDKNEPLGVISETTIKRIIKEELFNDQAAVHMDKAMNFTSVSSLQSALNQMNTNRAQYILVNDQGNNFLVEKRKILSLMNNTV